MELKYKRKLSANKFGSHYIAIPKAIVDAFQTIDVYLIFDGSHVRIEPVR